jgi:hypothetical protein
MTDTGKALPLPILTGERRLISIFGEKVQTKDAVNLSAVSQYSLGLRLSIFR